MTTLHYPNARPLYYRHSGRFAIGGILLALAAGSVAGTIGGAIYAYATLYIPIVYVCVLLTMGLGFGAGAVTAEVLYRTKTRNIPVTFATATAIATITLVAAWVFWLYAFCARADATLPPEDRLNLTIADLIANPRKMWRIIEVINEAGSFKLKNDTPTGIFLLIIWLVEAGIVYGFAVWYPISKINKTPFCENCSNWCVGKHLLDTATADDGTLKLALERRDFSVLAALRPRDLAPEWYDVSLQGCPNCDTTQTLCVDHVIHTVNKKGESKTKTKHIVRRLRLEPDEVVAVATAVAAVSVPPPSDAPTAPGESPASTTDAAASPPADNASSVSTGPGSP